MNVLNLKRKEEEVENTMAAIVGVDIKTLQSVRKRNIISRDCYRCVDRGCVGRNDVYFYHREKTIQEIERLRYEGVINKRRKRKKIRQRKTRVGSSTD